MASLPGATSCRGSRLGEESEPLVAPVRTGWPCANGSLYLAFQGPGQWGTGGSHRHICLASPRLCPLVALFGGTCSDQGLRMGYEERAKFSD